MKKSLLSLAVISALSSTLFAGDVRVSGFMNVVGGMNDLDPDDPSTSNEYRGYDNQYDFLNESLAAVQFSATITEKMGATIQLIAQKQEVNDDIRVEWAYIYYDASDEFRLLAGRIRPTLFLYSDYLDVGYAYSWITPPDEVYAQANISNLDGGSVAYTLELDDYQFAITAYGGNSADKLPNPMPNSTSPLDVDYDSIIGGEISFSSDYAKLRAGYIQASVTENTTLGQVPDDLAMDETSAAFYGLGLSVDYEDILFAAEYISRDMDGTGAPDVTSYYAMLGYKIGDFTPNYTYAVADSDMDFSSAQGTLPDGKPVAVVVNTIRAQNLDDRSSHTLGVRYDVNSQAALKLEWNMATLTHSTYDAVNKSLNEDDEDINTYRIALNVVF
jgi:hypothetical protein